MIRRELQAANDFCQIEVKIDKRIHENIEKHIKLKMTDEDRYLESLKLIPWQRQALNAKCLGSLAGEDSNHRSLAAEERKRMRRTKAGATVTIPDKIGYVTPVLRHSSSAFKLVRGTSREERENTAKCFES
ncbi:hypothetical protein VTP01DRAFT_3141 [Rhizomucor pusillus]|uniref:uncharacterized protein n=1 Tax=Rhizomucor pusillus TaxID=4840 RepID=UPI00374405FB